MRGLDWSALPIVVEMFGVIDVDYFVRQLVAIREWNADNPADD